MKPSDPAKYDQVVINAVSAFLQGKANEGQQITVRDWILHAVCQVEGMSFFTGESGQRLSDFAEGKRFVANQIRKMGNPITRAALEKTELKVEAKGKK